MVFDNLHLAVFPDHPLGFTILGSDDNIRHIRQSDVKVGGGFPRGSFLFFSFSVDVLSLYEYHTVILFPKPFLLFLAAFCLARLSSVNWSIGRSTLPRTTSVRAWWSLLQVGSITRTWSSSHAPSSTRCGLFVFVCSVFFFLSLTKQTDNIQRHTDYFCELKPLGVGCVWLFRFRGRVLRRLSIPSQNSRPNR